MSSCAAGLRARGYTKRFFPNSEILSLKLTAKSKYSNPNVGRQNPKQSTERLILRFIKISPPLLATNAFHDSNANITFLLLKFSPPLLATNALHDSDANITFLLSKILPPPLGN